MTKQEEQYVLGAFEPFLQPFEKRRVERITTPSGGILEGISYFDKRKFSCEQCMDFYRAYHIAMNSDRDDMKDMAMEAGKSAYHYLTHGDIEIGDGELITKSYKVGVLGPKPFESFTLNRQQELLYELAKGVRIKEQISILKQSGNILKKITKMEETPQNSREWNNLCEAVRIDKVLQDPTHFLTKTLAFERPGNLEKVMKARQDSLHDYLDKNNLPHEYEALKAHAESITGEHITELVDMREKTQWDVSFERIGITAHNDKMQIDPFDAQRSAIREAWLIDRMEPGDKKNEQIESFFKRAYDTIHDENYVQIKPGQNLQFPSGLDEELKREESFANMRKRGSVKNAEFLKDYPAYEQKRDAERLAIMDEDLRGLETAEQAL